MAQRVRLSTGGPGAGPDRVGARAWVVVGLLLIVPAALIAPADGLALQTLAWRPALALTEPWRWWSAAWVHLSASHRWLDLGGALLLTMAGAIAAPPRTAAWAWALAWPLTHFGLLLQPALARYVGLSGVLHAGAAVLAVHLLAGPRRHRAHRLAGALLLGGLAWRLAHERGWSEVLVRDAAHDYAVAPAAHLSGALCGLALGGLCWLVWSRSDPPADEPRRPDPAA